MSIRRAHMATFPARIETVKIALDSLHSQVDEIHLVLNEYTEIPAFLSRFSKVNPVLPKTDYKDVGKFVPRPDAEDIVFLVDDDLQYGAQYCEWMVGQATEIGWDDNVFGLHGSIYKRANGALTRKRQLFYYSKSLKRATIVDELGTGTVMALGKYIAPLDYMASAQKFVDVRYAKWCFENDLSRVSIARPRKLVQTIRNAGPSIYRSFTVTNPPEVLREMETYVGNAPTLGQKIGLELNLLARLGF